MKTGPSDNRRPCSYRDSDEPGLAVLPPGLTTNLDHQTAQEPLDRENRGLNKRHYLQQPGQSWYIRIKVPAALRGRVGNTHIRSALYPRDLDEANRRKWLALAQVRAYLDSLESGTPASLSLPMPSGIRGVSAIVPQTAAHFGLRPTTSPDALSEDWAITSPLKTVQFQRGQTYQELSSYLGGDLDPNSVTAAVAVAYVDERPLTSTDRPSTRRRKLSALGAFWDWMALRCYTPKGDESLKGISSRQERQGEGCQV